MTRIYTRLPDDVREKHKQIKSISCPECSAPPAAACKSPKGYYLQFPHQARRRAAADAGAYVPGGKP